MQLESYSTTCEFLFKNIFTWSNQGLTHIFQEIQGMHSIYTGEIQGNISWGNSQTNPEGEELENLTWSLPQETVKNGGKGVVRKALFMLI